MSCVQAVTFDASRWTPLEAKQWLRAHQFRAIKPVHRTKNRLRYRLHPPETFRHFATQVLDDGVELVIGFY